MKISILLPDLRGGGVERIRIVLAHEFVRAGHEVEFVLMQARGELLHEARSQFSIYDLKCQKTRHLLIKLMHYVRARKPDALLAGMWPLTGVAGLAVRLSRQSLRLVASEHVDFRHAASHSQFEKLVLKYFGSWFYAPCRSVVAVSDGVAESLAAIAGIPQNVLEVIHNPARPLVNEAMSESDRSLLSEWIAGEVRLIAIGSFIKAKGFDVLLHALKEVRQHMDAQLLILGDGPLRNEMENIRDNLGLSQSVYLPGFRPNPRAFFDYADAFVLSSNWEGFGNVIVEALSAGVPVVSTNCQSGPAEILDHGKYGILVSVGNHKDLAQGIMDILRWPKDTSMLRSRAKGFSPEKSAEAYLKLLT